MGIAKNWQKGDNMPVTVKQERLRDKGGMFSEVYPFSSTKVGKKFIFQIKKEDVDYNLEYSRLRAAAYAFYKRTGKKFQCRQSSDGILVIRIL